MSVHVSLKAAKGSLRPGLLQDRVGVVVGEVSSRSFVEQLYALRENWRRRGCLGRVSEWVYAKAVALKTPVYRPRLCDT